MTNKSNWQEMIPELLTFLDGKPASPELWLDNIGRYDHAIAYGLLFWPDFIEHEGCVFIGNSVPKSYPEWKAKFGDDRRAIEGMLNHQHIHDLFPVSPEPNGPLVAHLGQLPKEMRDAKLKRDFPDRKFTVFFPDKFEFGVDNPEITFYSGEEIIIGSTP